MSQSHLGSTTVAQIAVVVHDIEEVARRYAEVLGPPVPDVMITEPGLQVDQTYRGQPSDARAKLAFLPLGQVQLELTEPVGGPSTWQEALDRRGEGQYAYFDAEESLGLTLELLERVRDGRAAS